jgi:hypothetical protein
MRRSNRPGIYYGGLGRPQVLKGTALPFSAGKSDRFIELEGTIPLYKLHGSLNWGLEAGALRLYQDLRPAFRHGGDAQIVPPVVERKPCLASGRVGRCSTSSHRLLHLVGVWLLPADLRQGYHSAGR